MIRFRWAPAAKTFAPSALGGLVEGGHDPDGLVLPRISRGRGQDVAQLVQCGLEHHRGSDVSSGTRAPELIAGPPLSSATSWTEDTAKMLLGTTRAVTVPGIRPACSGFSAISMMLGRPWDAGVTLRTKPTRTPWYFTSEFCGNPSPTLRQFGDHRHWAPNRPVDLTNITPERGRRNHYRDACAQQLPIGRPTTIQFEGICHAYPPNLAPESTDQNAIVRSILTMIMSVMDARIARPAATPTPTGPPLA